MTRKPCDCFSWRPNGVCPRQCTIWGGRYLKGEGVPKNRIYAYAWFNLASETIPDSKAPRDTLAAELSANEKKEAEKLTRKWKKRFESRPRF